MLAFKRNITGLLKVLMIVAFVYFFWLMLKITWLYIPIRSDVAFLMIKQTEVNADSMYLPIFYVHVYTSIFILLFGFLAILRKNFGIAKLHRWTGSAYVILLLLFAAPSGIYMGIYANGNVYSVISFLILGILWWWTTFMAYRTARGGKFIKHKHWMWRSFALTLSAITLRMWKVVIVYLFHLPPMDTYQIIAWLGWLPNIILVEYLIWKKII
ncbi:DUF2306 domain-containing protein [Capnocytophaga canis]|uniref:DUF2306 domain-containing protein n=1 Tax=Capnocytophaga canis TaxID=1848903 RepID=UPI00370D0DB5